MAESDGDESSGGESIVTISTPPETSSRTVPLARQRTERVWVGVCLLKFVVRPDSNTFDSYAAGDVSDTLTPAFNFTPTSPYLTPALILVHSVISSAINLGRALVARHDGWQTIFHGNLYGRCI